MLHINKLLVLFMLLIASWQTFAAKTYQDYTFATQEESARFNALLKELRCLVCQNQSLSDSDATLAQDLRQKIYDLLQAGNSDEEIINYLLSRYGDFVLLNPPVTTKTYLLWMGPFLLLLIGAFIGGRAVHRIHKRYRADIL